MRRIAPGCWRLKNTRIGNSIPGEHRHSQHQYSRLAEYGAQGQRISSGVRWQHRCDRGFSAAVDTKGAAVGATSAGPSSPWDHVLSLAPYTGVQNGMSKEQLLELITHVKNAHKQQSQRATAAMKGDLVQQETGNVSKEAAEAAAKKIRESFATVQGSKGNAWQTGLEPWQPKEVEEGVDHFGGNPESDIEDVLKDEILRYDLATLPALLRIQGEVLLAHIYTSKIRLEAARGQHRGITNHGRGGQRVTLGSGDKRPVRFHRALCSAAHHNASPGVLMNALLGSPHLNELSPEFYALVCAKFLRSAEDLHRVLLSSKYVYEEVVRHKPDGHQTRDGSEFMDALWETDSLAMAYPIVRELVFESKRMADAPVLHVGARRSLESLITLAGTQTMHLAFSMGDRHLGNEVFRCCFWQLRTSLIAHSIRLHVEAMDGNVHGMNVILSGMKNRGIRADPAVWSDIINGMCCRRLFSKAKKLFAAHMMFLPTERSQEDDPQSMLYAPWSDAEKTDEEPSIWHEWYYERGPESNLDPKIWWHLWSHAQRYQEAPQTIQPWLPTIYTHRTMLKHMCKADMTTDVIRYYMLLKRVWPQYQKWAWRRKAQDIRNLQKDGFGVIQRLVHAHLAKTVPGVRDIYGLTPIPLDSAAPDLVNRQPTQYYHHRSTILKLARKREWRKPSADELVKETGYQLPDKIMFTRILREFSIQGDLRSMLYQMHRLPWLNDVAVWTALVQCICKQVGDAPGDLRMRYPWRQEGEDREGTHTQETQDPDPEESERDWLHFVFDLCQAVAHRGMAFGFHMYGSLVQTCVQLGDYKALRRVIDHMHRHSHASLTVDMVRMITKAPDCSLRAAWEFSKAAFNIDGIKDHLMNGTASPRRDPYSKPDRAFLSWMIRTAETREDLVLLRDVIGDMEMCFGVCPLLNDYLWAVKRCRALHLEQEYEHWTRLYLTEKHVLRSRL